MVYTSYFGKMKSFLPNMISIAICGEIPNWFGTMIAYMFTSIWAPSENAKCVYDEKKEMKKELK